MNSERKLANTLLVVFARTLADEMTVNGYFKEWSSAPLNELLPLFCKLLDHHPLKLGSILYDAYNSTLKAEAKKGLIWLVPEYPELYGHNRESFIDQYTAFTTTYDYSRDKPPLYSSEERALLESIARQVIHTFALLDPQQERPQRTMEVIAKQLAPLYYVDSELRNIGMDVREYSDYWRNIEVQDRPEFEQKVLSYNLQ